MYKKILKNENDNFDLKIIINGADLKEIAKNWIVINTLV